MNKYRGRYSDYQTTWRDLHREKAKEAARQWRIDHPEAARLHRANRRARIALARTQKYIKVINLHNWVSKLCGVCNEYIDGDYQLDHIVPLSRGGEHCESNLQLAHPYCNRHKFTKLPTELTGAIITS